MCGCKSSNPRACTMTDAQGFRQRYGVVVKHLGNKFEMPLDPGIEKAVLTLREANIATYESCEGGAGHSFSEPTVRFGGDHAEALRAVAAVLDIGLPIRQLRRVWGVTHGELDGPWWDLVFSPAIREGYAKSSR